MNGRARWPCCGSPLLTPDLWCTPPSPLPLVTKARPTICGLPRRMARRALSCLSMARAAAHSPRGSTVKRAKPWPACTGWPRRARCSSNRAQRRLRPVHFIMMWWRWRTNGCCFATNAPLLTSRALMPRSAPLRHGWRSWRCARTMSRWPMRSPAICSTRNW